MRGDVGEKGAEQDAGPAGRRRTAAAPTRASPVGGQTSETCSAVNAIVKPNFAAATYTTAIEGDAR